MSPYVRSIAGVAAAFRLRKTQAEACAYRKKICNVRVYSVFCFRLAFYNKFPRKNRIAQTVFTNGQIFIGIMGVLAPVKAVQTAIRSNITAEARNTVMETGLRGYKTIRMSTSAPIKHRDRPSPTHSMVRIRLLACEIGPKLSTIRFVGMIWDSPHKIIAIEPM
jgi:hypothetical protein